MSGTQSIRFRRPLPKDGSTVTPVVRKLPPEGMLKESTGRSKLPFAPSFSVFFRLLILVRVSGAMYTAVTSDCDEVFNYWEPLHYLLYGKGLQTWEYSPLYAIRSWAYLLLHAQPSYIAKFVIRYDKRPAFFALRLVLAFVSTLVECKLYRSIVDNISVRVGRYFAALTLVSAGMWNASTAFLPSTFALYFVNLATAYALEPKHADDRRTYIATACFAMAAIVGWPFAALLAIPFALEELLVKGQAVSSWQSQRVGRLVKAGMLGLSILIPLALIDSYFYGRLAIVPWNIVRYNVFSDRATLYGTEAWHYYLVNGALNFNLALPLALLSLPALAISNVYDRTRLGPRTVPVQTASPILLAFRLAPLYLWLLVLSTQPHKEERFLFPAYGLICFNAAMTLYLARGWLERYYINATKSPYRASKSKLFTTFTSSLLFVFILLSLARIGAIQVYYRAPMKAALHLQQRELPRLATAALPNRYLHITGAVPSNLTDVLEKLEEHFDLEPLRELKLRICWAKEWYRFPSSFLVPDVLDIGFVRSDFDGLVPRAFDARLGTADVPSEGFNDDNRAELSNYVPLESCHYVVDLDFPHRPPPSATSREPRLAVAKGWDRVACFPFLDAAHSPQLTRAMWLPLPGWTARNAYGDYCVLRRSRLP